MLTGLYEPTEGTVYLNGEDITPVKPHKRAAMGMARTFQNIRLFNLMTAEENVMVAMHSGLKAGESRPSCGCPGSGGRNARPVTTARELLQFVGIRKARASSPATCPTGTSGGSRSPGRMALRPKILLLDEPTAGMNPQESRQFNDFVYRVRDEKDMSVLLIEHDMSVIMKVSERITVLDRGTLIAEGTPDDIRNNQQVIEAYLGKTGTREGKRRKPARHASAEHTSDGDGMSVETTSEPAADAAPARNRSCS